MQFLHSLFSQQIHTNHNGINDYTKVKVKHLTLKKFCMKSILNIIYLLLTKFEIFAASTKCAAINPSGKNKVL